MAERPLSRRREGHDYPMMRNWENPFQSMQQAINRLFSDFWGEPSTELSQWQSGFIPTIDVSEDEKEIHITAELPGLSEKDITLTVRENALVIEGEKKREHEEKKENFYRRETSYGSFHRVITLPAEVDEAKAQAKFEKGVLRVDIPKSEAARRKERKIEIKAG